MNFNKTGGDKLDSFDWNEAWYPFYNLEDMDKSKPMKVKILNQDIVVWWDQNGTNKEALNQGLSLNFHRGETTHVEDVKSLKGCWRAYKDECPHRLVPLSEGRVNEKGELECPYHGWTF